MKLLTIVFMILLMASCHAPGNPVETQNSEIELMLLFEHDGCKIYRFRDGKARFVYWSDCRGQISFDRHVQTGKGSTTHHEVTIND